MQLNRRLLVDVVNAAVMVNFTLAAGAPIVAAAVGSRMTTGAEPTL